MLIIYDFKMAETHEDLPARPNRYICQLNHLTILSDETKYTLLS